MPEDPSTPRAAFPLLARLPGIEGEVVLVAAPGDPRVIDEGVLATLHHEEAAFAATLRGWQRHDFVAGRTAARHLLGAAAGPVLRGDGGQPLFPAAARGSISHKRTVAAALLAGPGQANLGLDVESLDGPGRAIEKRVLTDTERRRLAGTDASALIATFAVKEALYKALWPELRRYVAFREAAVTLATDLVGPASVDLLLDGATASALTARALVAVVGGHLVATATVLRG